jgi:hypothetical protein
LQNTCGVESGKRFRGKNLTVRGTFLDGTGRTDTLV